MDDDRAILEVYKELIARLPSRPDVQVADSGAAAVALLETEEFSLIVSDLRMFTHPNTEQLDPIPVAEVVTPALRFLSNESRDDVQIEQNLTAGQTIWANKNKLIQSL